MDKKNVQRQFTYGFRNNHIHFRFGFLIRFVFSLHLAENFYPITVTIAADNTATTANNGIPRRKEPMCLLGS